MQLKAYLTLVTLGPMSFFCCNHFSVFVCFVLYLWFFRNTHALASIGPGLQRRVSHFFYFSENLRKKAGAKRKFYAVS